MTAGNRLQNPYNSADWSDGFYVTDSAGAPIDYSSYSIIAQLRGGFYDELQFEITKAAGQITTPAVGYINFSVPYTTMKDIKPGIYRFSVVAVSSLGDRHVVKTQAVAVLDGGVS
jgi:hypothetical protein